MKKQIFPIISVLLFVCYLTSCSVPAVSNETANYDGNTIGIQVKLPGGVSKAVFGPDDAALYKIEMSLDEAVVQSKTGAPGDTIILKVDKEGKYVVTVSAYNVDNTEIAKGSVTTDLKFGKGIIPLQIKIKGYQKIIEIQPEIIWETDEIDYTYGGTDLKYLFEDDVLESKYVKIQKVDGGIKFTLTRPEFDCYNPNVVLSEKVMTDSEGNPLYDSEQPLMQRTYGGWGYTAIYCIEPIDGKLCWTTCAHLSNYSEKEVMDCIYSLCEAGKRYVFAVLIQPSNLDEYFDYKQYEYVSILAEDGIGDIDYSGFRANSKVNLIYDGEKPIVTVTNYTPSLPDNALNINSCYDVDVGNGDYYTKGATKYLGAYFGNKGVEYDIAVDPFIDAVKDYKRIVIDENGIETEVPYYTDEELEQMTFKTKLVSSDKDEFYVEYYITFNMPNDSDCGILEWRTSTVGSNIVSFR